jgi:AmmeMemoRadiSam system protein B
VAGFFYPAEPAALKALVDRLLDGVDVPAADPRGRAYVVPHAGYRFSGPTAAHVYARLRRHADRIRRVLLLGPAHRVPLKGCAVPTAARWLTPLGEVVVDPVTATLADGGHATADDVPHAPEHSLEVQLPFLQRAVPAATVVPVAVGASTADDVAAVAAATAAPDTVVLCSTDLSHYLPDAEARRQDERTAAAIEALAPERVGVRDACGVYALRGTLAWAAGEGLAARRLALATSADTAGDPSRVVGYPAFVFHAV